jgi:hypothetical protein
LEQNCSIGVFQVEPTNRDLTYIFSNITSIYNNQLHFMSMLGNIYVPEPMQAAGKD